VGLPEQFTPLGVLSGVDEVVDSSNLLGNELQFGRLQRFGDQDFLLVMRRIAPFKRKTATRRPFLWWQYYFVPVPASWRMAAPREPRRPLRSLSRSKTAPFSLPQSVSGSEVPPASADEKMGNTRTVVEAPWSALRSATTSSRIRATSGGRSFSSAVLGSSWARGNLR
jgi:hypothetical protein